jgi:hypothetical protein
LLRCNKLSQGNYHETCVISPFSGKRLKLKKHKPKKSRWQMNVWNLQTVFYLNNRPKFGQIFGTQAMHYMERKQPT